MAAVGAYGWVAPVLPLCLPKVALDLVQAPQVQLVHELLGRLINSVLELGEFVQRFDI